MEDAGITLSKEEGQTASKRSKDIVIGTLEALNEAFASESAEVIGHLAAAVIRLGEMGSDQGAKGSVSKAFGQVAELAQAGEEGHDAWITKAKTGARWPSTEDGSTTCWKESALVAQR